MKKTLVLLLALSVALLAFSGCKSKQQKALEELGIYQEGGMDYGDFDYGDFDYGDFDASDFGGYDPAAGAETYYKELDSLNVPSGFPSELVYSPGKVISVQDAGSGADFIDVFVDVVTKDSYSEVKDHYKDMLASEGWNVTSEDVSVDTYYANAEMEEMAVYVSVYKDYPVFGLTQVGLEYHTY